MSLEYVLLGLLREPSSGYDLKKQFDERISYIWRAELSQIYPTLKRLEKRGLIESHEAEAKRGPSRRVYRLTSQGRAELQTWLTGPPHVTDERMAWLAQLYFMGELRDLRQTLAYFRSLRSRFAARLAAFQSIEQSWAATDSGYPNDIPIDDLHVHFTLRKGLHSLAAHLDWCDESIAVLRSRIEGEHATASPTTAESEETP